MATKEDRLGDMLSRAKAEIVAGGRFRSPECLALLHKKDPGGFRLSLKQSAANGKIFSIEHHGQPLYPDFAFSDKEGGLLLPCLAEVITALNTTNDAWGLAFWFRTPNNFLQGKRPEDLLLQAPEIVLRAAFEACNGIMHG
ncbi:DUF2384 domain-containing protein [Pseudomonas syringae]|uniref:DUF2384 domain-containing protein n=1 Tax=Pseudomonas syringae TaxID=317 RepID=UPI0012AEDA6E|nr:DUF2384 domain-containing protein [Pseudomonas syringae]